MPTTRFQFILAFIALMLLRVVVGFHFFKEGTDKIAAGNFSAEPFLKAATGPWASHFHDMIEDHDGALRFCLDQKNGTGKPKLDPSLSIAIWDDFLDQAHWYYNLGDAKLEQTLISRREDLADEIKLAREKKDRSVNTRELEQQRAEDEVSLKQLREQRKLAEEILASHSDELRSWLAVNEPELQAYFGSKDRANGFDRDGDSRGLVATHVESLRDQVDEIKQDRQKQLYGWSSEVEAIWDSYESSINGLAVDQQASKTPLKLHRPYQQSNSQISWVNRIIPWFDTIVGALLIIGLFTRFASAAGAIFLVSVIATQPPWIPDAQPTYLYAVELAALIVIFATLAGRMGGLDFFFAGRKKAAVNQGETLAQAG